MYFISFVIVRSMKDTKNSHTKKNHPAARFFLGMASLQRLEERIRTSVYLFSGFYQFSNSQACHFVITRVLEASEFIRH
jgi:hypothetical protein